jgi:hypothetical protein
MSLAIKFYDMKKKEKEIEKEKEIKEENRKEKEKEKRKEMKKEKEEKENENEQETFVERRFHIQSERLLDPNQWRKQINQMLTSPLEGRVRFDACDITISSYM